MSLPGVDHEPALFAWVLIQYLWQGCLVAALAVVADARWFRSSHRIRYKVLESCAALFWLLPFWLLWVGLWKLHVYLSDNATGRIDPSTDLAPIRLIVSGLLAHPLLLAAIWLAGATWQFSRLAVNWVCLHSLDLAPVSDSLTGLLNKAQEAAGIPKLPDCYEADVAVPFVFGAMKPRLVVPQDFASMLQQNEIEALLLHELAHVKRRDYLRNLVYRAFTCVFWFHPASWFLIQRLARRRELCCDADAIQSCSSATLGRALIKLVERAHPSLAAAVEVSSIAGALETRLLALSRPDWNGTTPTLLHVGVVSLLFVLTVAVAVRPSQTEFLRLAQDPQMIVHAHDDAGPFELRIRHGRVVNAVLGRETISEESIIQRGTAVLISGRAGETSLSLTLEPSGGIRWNSRTGR